jgi:hypothetical protein
MRCLLRPGMVMFVNSNANSAQGTQCTKCRLALSEKNDNDDALFEILDGTGRVAVVHLTWATQEVKYPWPSTTFFSSLDEFVEKRMKEDHADWIFPEQA